MLMYAMFVFFQIDLDYFDRIIYETRTNSVAAVWKLVRSRVQVAAGSRGRAEGIRWSSISVVY